MPHKDQAARRAYMLARYHRKKAADPEWYKKHRGYASLSASRHEEARRFAAYAIAVCGRMPCKETLEALRLLRQAEEAIFTKWQKGSRPYPSKRSPKSLLQSLSLSGKKASALKRQDFA